MMHLKLTYWPKLDYLKPENISHAEAFESALRDQMSMSSTPDIARMSTYHRQKSNAQQNNMRNSCTRSQPNHANSRAQPNNPASIGCGSHQHGVLGMGSRQLKCPAWGQTGNYCGKANHFSDVSRAKKNFGEQLQKALKPTKPAWTHSLHILQLTKIWAHTQTRRQAK